MNHLRLRLLLAALPILSIVTCAWASPHVYPPNCTVPAAARAVDSQSGVPDYANGQFTIVIRDLANNVTNGASVVLDLSAVSDVVLCSDQLDPDMLINCSARTVRKFTNTLGQVTFTLLGSSTGMADSPSPGQGKIFANGVLVGYFDVSTFDLDGTGGVGANDLSVWLADFGSGLPHPRSDYDASGDVSANDLSQWLGVFGAGGSAQSCGAGCP